MAPVPVSFQFEEISAARRAFDVVARRFVHDRQASKSRSTTYYDTFDWRLYSRDTVLYSQFDGGAKKLVWSKLDGTPLQQTTIEDKPRFAWELPVGALRDQIGPLVEMRRLLPTVTVEAQSEALNILDGRRKTVSRVHLESAKAHPARGAHISSELPPVLRAQPVRGYGRQFEALLAVLAELDLVQAAKIEFVLAATATGLDPGSYSSKVSLSLDPHMCADDAVRTILKYLLGVIRQNEPGLKANLDSEFLHDFRVAVRRTRSVLSQLKGVLPPSSTARFKKDFSWLGQITGPTRDLDVYQLKIPGYRASLPEHLRSDLDPLNEFLRRHQSIERRDLVQLLGTDRYTSLLSDWQDFLDQPNEEDPLPAEAKTPILEVASQRIWHCSRRVLDKGGAIDPDTPAQALHRLRIECKKLRYLLEFFRSLYPNRQLVPLIKALKHLQDNLGDYNDLEVQRNSLAQFARSMVAEKLGTASALMAMGRLVERLETRQSEERQEFHRRFSEFSTRRNRARFKELFKDPGTSAA